MSTVVLSPLAVGGIRLYQRYISPYKGFRCANRAGKKGWSCSEFGRRVFARYEVTMAYALLQRRFAACKQSYARLSAGRFAAVMAAVPAAPEAQEGREPKRQQKTSNDIGGCNSCDVPNIDVCAIADIGVCDCSF